MLAPEQSNFTEGVLKINRLSPFHRHEVLAILGVIEAMVIFTNGIGLKKGKVPIGGSNPEVFGRLCSPFHQSHSHVSGTRHINPDTITRIEKLKSPAVPRSTTSTDEAEADGVFPRAILIGSEGAIELPRSKVLVAFLYRHAGQVDRLVLTHVLPSRRWVLEQEASHRRD